MPKKQRFPALLIISGALLLVAALIMLTTINTQNGPSAGGETSDQDVFPQVVRINQQQAKEAFDANAAVFVDVRDPVYYENSHIPGALSIPLSEIGVRFTELDPDDWIILYCT